MYTESVPQRLEHQRSVLQLLDRSYFYKEYFDPSAKIKGIILRCFRANFRGQSTFLPVQMVPLHISVFCFSCGFRSKFSASYFPNTFNFKTLGIYKFQICNFIFGRSCSVFSSSLIITRQLAARVLQV